MANRALKAHKLNKSNLKFEVSFRNFTNVALPHILDNFESVKKFSKVARESLENIGLSLKCIVAHKL